WTKRRLEACRAAGMIAVTVRDHDELDVLGVETQGADIRRELIGVRLPPPPPLHALCHGGAPSGRAGMLAGLAPLRWRSLPQILLGTATYCPRTQKLAQDLVPRVTV